MDDQGKTVLARFLVGLVAVIVIAGLVWVIFLRGDSGKKNSSEQRKTTSSNQSKETDEDDGNTQGVSHTNNPTGSQNNNAGNSQLAETGPGDVAVVFGVATVLGTVVHYTYRRRASARTVR